VVVADAEPLDPVDACGAGRARVAGAPEHATHAAATTATAACLRDIT
jgi:hypothetical protein